MTKREQVLLIDPPVELSFTGPFDKAVTSSMKLKNPGDKKVCFKIKTTAPKRYCVKPNSGVVNPSSETYIAVSLQPFEYDPAEKNKHKFMVQSMFAPDGDIDQDKLWKEADSNEMMDSKLKCVFVMPAGGDENNVAESKPESKTSAAYLDTKPMIQPVKEEGDQNVAAVQEIKKLNEAISQLRQENLLLKEETMRLKRIAAASEKPESSSYSSTTVAAVAPTGEGLSTVYIYAALAILVIGMIFGKFFL